MRFIALSILLSASIAFAQQPAGSGSAGSAAPTATEPAGSGSAAAGSAAPTATEPAGSGSAAAAPAPPEPPVTGDAAELRKTCAAAMNADPSFAEAIVKKAELQLHEQVAREQVMKDAGTLRAHQEAQDDVAKNKKHVIMAYAAMWIVAVGFVLFLWRRQQALKTEILQLRRDLDAATKDDK